MAQTVKRLPATQETQIRSLEKGMATHPSPLAWESQTGLSDFTFTFTFYWREIRFPEEVGLGGKARLQKVEELMEGEELETVKVIDWQ